MLIDIKKLGKIETECDELQNIKTRHLIENSTKKHIKREKFYYFIVIVVLI